MLNNRSVETCSVYECRSATLRGDSGHQRESTSAGRAIVHDRPLTPPRRSVSVGDYVELRCRVECGERATEGSAESSRFSYRMKLGRETILLGPVEYRILRFLAAKPYRAYTRRRIAKAVTTHRHPVTEEAMDRHIASLRDKLGFFWNYIQTVPYVGYRFKA
jgi:hypothetical protein